MTLHDNLCSRITTKWVVTAMLLYETKRFVTNKIIMPSTIMYRLCYNVRQPIGHSKLAHLAYNCHTGTDLKKTATLMTHAIHNNDTIFYDYIINLNGFVYKQFTMHCPFKSQ